MSLPTINTTPLFQTSLRSWQASWKPSQAIEALSTTDRQPKAGVIAAATNPPIAEPRENPMPTYVISVMRFAAGLYSAINAVADALTAHGFAAHAEARGSSLAIINEHCPFGGAAMNNPVICAVDRGMVRGMLAGLYGAAEAFFRPAAGGLIPRLVPDAALLQANSLIAMSQSLGMVLGPAIAGVLIALLGPGSAIAIDAASFLVSAACLWRMTPRPAARTHTETGAAFLEQLREGWGEVTSRVWLRSFLGVLGSYHLIALPCSRSVRSLPTASSRARRAGR